VKDLEKKIQETEKELSAVQSDFADPQVAKDPHLYKKMQDQYSQLRETLDQLEAEYFARETA